VRVPDGMSGGQAVSGRGNSLRLFLHLRQGAIRKSAGVPSAGVCTGEPSWRG